MNGGDRESALAARAYRGLWAVLREWFRVPEAPPELPPAGHEVVVATRPAPGYLRYLRFWFWLGLSTIDAAIVGTWIVLMFTVPLVGVALALPMLAVAIVPDVVAYVVMHLRYDTTWYVTSDRAIRIRRGVWIQHETTISFENVQDVSVRQGPVQRRFGIADVMIRTAGGGAAAGPHGAMGGAHVGVIQGVADAEALREGILDRVRRSRSAGLGDERDHEPAAGAWTPAHLEVLREIRDLARAR